MKFVKKVLVGVIVGTIIGQVFGVLLVFVFAPRHWVTMQWMVLVSPQGAAAGAIGGVVIGVSLWVLGRRTTESVHKNLNQVPPRKVAQVFWGVVNGVVLGCIGGMAIEAIIDVGRLLLSAGEMQFLVSNFSPVLYGSPVLGAIAGGLYAYARGLTQKAISRLIRGVCSGIILGASAGVLWVVSTCWWIPLTNSSQIAGYGYMTAEVAIGTTVFGVIVGVVAEMIFAHRVLNSGDLPTEVTHNIPGEQLQI